MKVSNKIIQLIKEIKFIAVKIKKTSNIFTDLGFDSLSFICLILKIEEHYSIKFELLEMSQCVFVSQIIALAEQKIQII